MQGPKQPTGRPASPNVVVFACVTNPRLATRAARIIPTILAWLVPAAVSTHRGLCCARRQLPCAVHLSPLAFFVVPSAPMTLLATAFAPLGGFHPAGSRLHSRSGRLHPRNQVVGRLCRRIRGRGRSSLWRRGRNSLWRRGLWIRRGKPALQRSRRFRLRSRARWHRRRRRALVHGREIRSSCGRSSRIGRR